MQVQKISFYNNYKYSNPSFLKNERENENYIKVSKNKYKRDKILLDFCVAWVMWDVLVSIWKYCTKKPPVL